MTFKRNLLPFNWLLVLILCGVVVSCGDSIFSPRSEPDVQRFVIEQEADSLPETSPEEPTPTPEVLDNGFEIKPNHLLFSNFIIEYAWIDFPIRGKSYGRVELIFLNLNGEALEQIPVDVYEKTVFLFMPSMNHGALPISFSFVKDPIVYLERITPSMAGDWVIRFKFANEEQKDLPFIFE